MNWAGSVVFEFNSQFMGRQTKFVLAVVLAATLLSSGCCGGKTEMDMEMEWVYDLTVEALTFLKSPTDLKCVRNNFGST